MKNIELPTGNFTLKLISKLPKNPRWISVFLWEDDKEMIRLGAEADSYIANRFLLFLNPDCPLPEAGIINDVSYRWIASLSEVHAVFYGRRTSEGVEIYLQDADNLRPITTISLSQEKCNIWIQKLNDLLD